MLLEHQASRYLRKNDRYSPCTIDRTEVIFHTSAAVLKWRFRTMGSRERLLSRMRSMASVPKPQQKWSGVLPSPSSALISAPRSNNSFTKLGEPLRQAQCKGVLRYFWSTLSILLFPVFREASRSSNSCTRSRSPFRAANQMDHTFSTFLPFVTFCGMYGSFD